MERVRAAWQVISRNPGVKLVSFMIAVIAWLWVQGRELGVQRLRVPVSYTFADHLVPVEELPPAVNITLEGTRSALRRAGDGSLTLEVDLTNEKVGPAEFVLENYPVDGLPQTVKVRAVRPDRVRVRIDERTTRNVPVEPAWLGEPAAGFTIGEVLVEPDVAEVSGPRAVLDTMAVLRIKPIDLTGRDESGEMSTELDLPRNVRAAQPWTGRARVTVEAQSMARTISDVPVLVAHPDYVPAESNRTLSVLLQGPTDILRGIRSDWILVKVDLPEDASEERYTVPFQAAATPRMDIVHPRPDVVRVHTPPPPVTVVRR